MSKSKSLPSNDTPENPIQVLKQGTCPTSSGKSTLGYEVGTDETGEIHLRVSSNDGGGFFSNEWVSYTAVQVALNNWPADQGVTSMTFHKIFRGKSANTPGFLIAVLCAEDIIEPMGEKKRVHQPCDPEAFLASVQALRKGTTAKTTTKTKAASSAKAASAEKASKAKTPATEKSKTPAKGTDKTAKTSGRSGATSRKGK